jgi:hypothetical protein
MLGDIRFGATIEVAGRAGDLGHHGSMEHGRERRLRFPGAGQLDCCHDVPFPAKGRHNSVASVFEALFGRRKSAHSG